MEIVKRTYNPRQEIKAADYSRLIVAHRKETRRVRKERGRKRVPSRARTTAQQISLRLQVIVLLRRVGGGTRGGIRYMPAPRTDAVSAHNEESSGEAQPGGTASAPLTPHRQRVLGARAQISIPRPAARCLPLLSAVADSCSLFFLFGKVARLEGRANKREIVRDGRKL